MSSPLTPRFEADLLADFSGYLPGFLRRNADRYRVGHEITAGRTIADIVLLLSPRERWPSMPTQPLSTAESVVLATLRKQGEIAVADLEVMCGFKTGSLGSGVLRSLSERGLVRVDAAGRARTRSQWARSLRVIACEAKLLKWRQALRQAIEYQRFADEAYVILPARRAEQALKAKADFASSGVGLLVVDNRSIIRAIAARRSFDHDWSREYVCSRLASTSTPA